MSVDHANNLLYRFIELARVFLEGRGMPFLGAGVSMSARAVDNAMLTPTVSSMIELLVDAVFDRLTNWDLCEILYQLGACPSFSCTCPSRLCNSSECNAINEETITKEAFVNGINGQLGKLCEILIQRELLSQAEVVAALRIKDYAKLEPRPAHYYLAFLAQETLVNEIITTNYDCCLERAISTVAGKAYPDDKTDEKQAVSIFNLGSYREHGARRLFPYNIATVLRIYKINGCADQLNNNVGHADSILLTERQLQHMDDRAWARDLLCDRARSRAMVFSGFGSDEPQVRFTVLRLLEEFSADSLGNNPQNGIWLHLYSEQRSFSQDQVMHSFWGKRERIEAHTFSGNDAYRIDKLFSEQAGGGKNILPADIFWQVLYQLVFLALIDRYTSPPYPGWRWLAELDEQAKGFSRRHELLQWLDPAGIGKSIQGNQTGIDPEAVSLPLQVVDWLTGFKNSIPGMPQGMKISGIPLSLWIRCLCGKRTPTHRVGWYNPPECFYIPLLQQTNLVISLLMLICCFKDTEGNQPPLKVEFYSDGRAEKQYTQSTLLFLFFRGFKILLCSQFTHTFAERGTHFIATRTILAGCFNQTSFFGPGLPKQKLLSRNTLPTALNGVGEIKVLRFLPVPVQTLIRLVSADGRSNEEQDASCLRPSHTTSAMSFFARVVVALANQPTRPQRQARITRIDDKQDRNDDECR